MIDFYFFSGGNYGGSEPTCYWWLNSHLKLGKQHGLSSRQQTAAVHKTVIQATHVLEAHEHGEKHHLKVATATTAVAESGVWGAVGEQRCSAGGSPLCQLTPGWRRLSWVFQVHY